MITTLDEDQLPPCAFTLVSIVLAHVDLVSLHNLKTTTRPFGNILPTKYDHTTMDISINPLILSPIILRKLKPVSAIRVGADQYFPESHLIGHDLLLQPCLSFR